MTSDAERALIVGVHLFADRWHGTGDWPPSPFRLFQALVAGAYGGRWNAEGNHDAYDSAFLWLECLAPPIIGKPTKADARVIKYYVPNNDLDAVGGDPRRTAEIRTAKSLHSEIFDAPPSFMYAWTFTGEEHHAELLVELSNRLHTFGRGIDAAYATAMVVDASEIDQAFAAHSLRHSKPSEGSANGSTILPCPQSGSLGSLFQRFDLTQKRLQHNAGSRSGTIQFTQPPKARAREIAYDVPPARLVLELRDLEEIGHFYPVRLTFAAPLAVAIRDFAFDRLSKAIGRVPELERVILGRHTDDRNRGSRARFIPLPSIGSAHTDPSIRRVLIELPPECPLEISDLRWALAGQRLPGLNANDEQDRARGIKLVESTSDDMLWHYGVDKAADRWQTVTPAVLPIRLRPGRHAGSERARFDELATLSVADAVRQAGVETKPSEVRTQLEPFLSRGNIASAFEHDRFEGARLRHVELVLSEGCCGPLLIGDGRWLGLGLLRPVWRKAEREGQQAALDLDDGDIEFTVDESETESTDEV